MAIKAIQKRTTVAVLVVAWMLLAGMPFGASLPVMDDDAGSGRDAPAGFEGAVPIEPGRVYDGVLTGIRVDDKDTYAFQAEAGDDLMAHAWGPVGCMALYDPDERLVTDGCASYETGAPRLAHRAHASGTWYVQYYYLQAQHYRFSVGVNGEAPWPGLVLLDILSEGGYVPRPTGAAQTGPHVVVAVVDTGINPYHEFFRAPTLVDHPSAWLAGFPADATPVGLTLEAPGIGDALAADETTWAGLRRATYDPSTDTFDAPLYTFPGTRVVAGVSFGEYDDAFTTEMGARPVFDDHGHGTHSAGLALGADAPRSEGNVLVVMVEVGKGTFEEGIRWAARQPWIDAVSISLGVLANGPFTMSPLGDRQGVEWATLEAAASGKPVLVAAGNGFTGTGVAPDHCSTHTSPYTGPAWITRIGAADPNTRNPTSWHCLPVEAIARTTVLSPDHGTFSGTSRATGTSAATPNVAGHWALLMLEARRAGLETSRQDVLEHLLHAARPAGPVLGLWTDPSTSATAPLHQGYGLVDGAALERAAARLLAGDGPEPRPELDAWWTTERTIRTSLWGPGSLTSGDALG